MNRAPRPEAWGTGGRNLTAGIEDVFVSREMLDFTLTWRGTQAGDRGGVADEWLAAREDWRFRAACRSADPELFFPISPIGTLKQVTMAKTMCAGCSVRHQCLAFAFLTRQAHGIWGGLTEQERQSELAGRRKSMLI